MKNYYTKLLEALLCVIPVCIILLVIFNACMTPYKVLNRQLEEQQQQQEQQLEMLNEILEEAS